MRVSLLLAEGGTGDQVRRQGRRHLPALAVISAGRRALPLFREHGRGSAGRGIYVGTTADPVLQQSDRLLAAESGATFVARAARMWGHCSRCNRAVSRRGRSMRAPSTFTGDGRTLALPAVDASPRFPALLDASADVLTVAQTPIWSGRRLVVMSMTGERLQVPHWLWARRVSASLTRRPATRANLGRSAAQQRRPLGHGSRSRH